MVEESPVLEVTEVVLEERVLVERKDGRRFKLVDRQVGHNRNHALVVRNVPGTAFLSAGDL